MANCADLPNWGPVSPSAPQHLGGAETADRSPVHLRVVRRRIPRAAARVAGPAEVPGAPRKPRAARQGRLSAELAGLHRGERPQAQYVAASAVQRSTVVDRVSMSPTAESVSTRTSCVHGLRDARSPRARPDAGRPAADVRAQLLSLGLAGRAVPQPIRTGWHVDRSGCSAGSARAPSALPRGTTQRTACPVTDAIRSYSWS